MPNAFTSASNNGGLPPTIPTVTQAGFSVTQPGGPSTGVFSCSPMISDIRFPTGIFPYGMNGGTFQSMTFPTNWNSYSYNDPVNHFNSLQSHADQIQTHPHPPHPTTHAAPTMSVGTGSVIVAHPNIEKQSATNVGQETANLQENNLQGSQTSDCEQITDSLAEKVSNLLCDPNILKSALSKLQSNVPDKETADAGNKAMQSNGKVTAPPSSSVHLSTSSVEPVSNYQSDTDTSLDMESDFTVNPDASTTSMCNTEVGSVQHSVPDDNLAIKARFTNFYISLKHLFKIREKGSLA